MSGRIAPVTPVGVGRRNRRGGVFRRQTDRSVVSAVPSQTWVNRLSPRWARVQLWVNPGLAALLVIGDAIEPLP
jgi:hypothetical protein